MTKFALNDVVTILRRLFEHREDLVSPTPHPLLPQQRYIHHHLTFHLHTLLLALFQRQETDKFLHLPFLLFWQLTFNRTTFCLGRHPDRRLLRFTKFHRRNLFTLQAPATKMLTNVLSRKWTCTSSAIFKSDQFSSAIAHTLSQAMSD